ncbi:MAG: hypothetical protein RLZZ393_1086, partial [Pseudomonadota bacterium]
MSNIVSIVFLFHFFASLAWFAVCGFGALKVVTQRVKQRFTNTTVADVALTA